MLFFLDSTVFMWEGVDVVQSLSEALFTISQKRNLQNEDCVLCLFELYLSFVAQQWFM